MHFLAYFFWQIAHGEKQKFRTKMFHEIGFCKTGSFLALLQHSREKAARN
jgi:hypothetical protein